MKTKAKVILSYVILSIMIIGLVVFASNRHETLISVRNQASQNIVAMSDTISTYEDANGELVSSKAILEMTVDQLEITNDSLAQWIKANPGEVITITKIKYVQKYDTIYVAEGVVTKEDNRYSISFIYDTTQMKFTSVTSFTSEDSIAILNPSLLVTGLIIDAGITTAIVDVDGIKKILVTSDNPAINITNITGNIIPEDQVKFLDKFGVGFAFGPTINYDLIYNDVSVGIGITAGLVYKKYHR